MRLLETDTSSNTNIASATSVASYTADAAREVIARVLVDQAAGAGDYIVYAKIQRGGSGSSYVMLPKTTGTAASGETAIGFVSISLPVSTGDVVTIWVDGLAGDTTTPDIITDWYEVDALRPTTADRTLDVSSGGEAGVDWANVGTPGSTVSLSGTTVATVTTAATATNVTTVNGLAANVITASSIATDAIGASELAADAVAEIQSGLATASALTTAQTDLTTLTGRLSAARAGYLDNLSAGAVATASALATLAGKFTGITLLSEWLGALAGKQTANSTARTEIRATGAGGGTYDETTDSQEALRDRGDAAWTTGAGADPTTIRDTVWGTTDGTRTVTQTGAQVADAIDGEDLTVHRGDTFSATLTGITIPTDWTKLVFTAKRGLSDADSASVVQIVLTNPSAGTDGLKYLEGADPVSPVVAADAALTVPGLTSLTITMKPHATKELGIGSGWFYDVQADYGAASNSTTVCAGAFAVDADVTRAVPS